jgi:hypothetical protein
MESSEKHSLLMTLSERKNQGLYREQDSKVRCQFCNTFFTRNSDCLRHEKNYHNVSIVHKCILCGESYNTSEELKIHRQTHEYKSKDFKVVKEAFNGATRTYRLGSDASTLKSCFSDDVQHEILKICQSEMIQKKRAYFTQAVHAIF